MRAPQYEIQLDLRLPALNWTKLSGAKIADIAQFLPDVRKPKRASQLPAQSARGFAAHDRPPPVPQVLREKGLQPDASAGLPVLHIQAAQNEIGDVGAGALVDALLQLKRHWTLRRPRSLRLKRLKRQKWQRQKRPQRQQQTQQRRRKQHSWQQKRQQQKLPQRQQRWPPQRRLRLPK